MKTGSNIISGKLEEAFKKNDGTIKKWIGQAERLLSATKGKYARCYSGEDVIQELAILILEGKRKWDIEKVPDINAFMYYQIRSKVYDILKKEKKTAAFEEYRNEETIDTDEEFLEDTGSTSDDKIEEKIEERELTEICEKMLEKDDECLLVFYEMMKGNENRNIAECFGITNSQTAVIKKRMMRKLYQMVPEYYV